MITPAFAQGAAAAAEAPNPLISFAPFILIFVVMYFLMIRPQQRKAKEHRQMLNAVRRGDTIVTAGGLVAKVTKVTDEQSDIEVEISNGVKVQLVRSMIADVRTRSEPVKGKDASTEKK
ncbi:preprotein translocase subunit YajC [Microvirga sp. W0021]|uniref:Sec translocon accessory complex subunit YajC n=1 Tax=Hohaiivirga grylli TaxID=3133970 RepID=A0ABV0BIW7_9HYPH